MKKLLFMLMLSSVTIGYSQSLESAKLIYEKDGKCYLFEGGKRSLVNDKVITVKLKDGQKMDTRITPLRKNKLGYIDLEVPNGISFERYANQLAGSGVFDLVKYNTYALICDEPNDEFIDNQWYLDSIRAFNAWNITMGNPNVKVAVIDAFPDATHPDLDNGSDGYANINRSLGTDYTDFHSTDHGLSVSGIISAKSNNGIGIAGLGGGNNTTGVSILPFNVSAGSNSVDMSVVDDAIIDATDNGAKVINMSFRSMLTSFPDVNDAIEYAYNHGVLMVAASGNDSDNSWIGYPASNPYVIAVGAVGQSLSRSTFSNAGNGLDLVAPGENIYTLKDNNSYNYCSGTSFSTPQVAGTAALMLSINPNLTPGMARDLIRNTCIKLSGYSYNNLGWNSEVGYGLLNTYEAVQSVPYISGPTIPCSMGIYEVVNLPANSTVSWSLSGIGLYTTREEVPYDPNNNSFCVRRNYHAYARGTVTASILQNGVEVNSVTKLIDTGINFSGTWRQQTSIFNQDTTNVSPKPLECRGMHIINLHQTVILQSSDFIDADITYTTNGLSIINWSNNNGTISFFVGGQSGSVTINGYNSTTCEAFTFRLMSMPNPIDDPILDPILSLGINATGSNYTFTLESEDETVDTRAAQQQWNLSIVQYETGRTMYDGNTTGTSISVNTATWQTGIYIVTATMGDKKVAKKIIIGG